MFDSYNLAGYWDFLYDSGLYAIEKGKTNQRTELYYDLIGKKMSDKERKSYLAGYNRANAEHIECKNMTDQDRRVSIKKSLKERKSKCQTKKSNHEKSPRKKFADFLKLRKTMSTLS